MRNERSHRASSDADEFKEIVLRWANRLSVKPRQIRVQKMTRKWASCSTKGWVTFSSNLLGKPFSFQDFVVVHELLHLRIPNHGKLFKSMLSVHVPKWESIARVHGNGNHRDL